VQNLCVVDGLWGPLQLLQTDQLVTLIMNVLLLPGDYASDFDTLLLLQVSILCRALPECEELVMCC